MHPFLVLACVLSPRGDELRVFALNRHLKEPLELELHVVGLCLCTAAGGSDLPNGVIEWVELRHEQLTACNSEDQPDKVHPRQKSGAEVREDGVRATLAPASWNMLRVAIM